MKKCKNCGGELAILSINSYQCLYCGNEYSDNSSEIRSVFNADLLANNHNVRASKMSFGPDRRPPTTLKCPKSSCGSTNIAVEKNYYWCMDCGYEW